jgi:transposase-like protein
MEELEKLYGKGLLNQIKQEIAPPPSKVSQLDYERPTPKTPVPENAQTSTGDKQGKYVCQKCKKSFNSKDELELHIETLHKTRKIPAQQ